MEGNSIYVTCALEIVADFGKSPCPCRTLLDLFKTSQDLTLCNGHVMTSQCQGQYDSSLTFLSQPGTRKL